MAATCDEKGGLMLEADGVNPSCYIPDSEAERKSNRDFMKFRRACEALNGLELNNDAEARTCLSLPDRLDQIKDCRTSADCEGTCITDSVRDDMGTCGPKKPILGCFVEFGAAKRNVICAE